MRSSLIALCLFLLATTPAQADSASAGELTLAVIVEINGQPVPPTHGTAIGFWLFASGQDAQLAMMGHPPRRAIASLAPNQSITLRASTRQLVRPTELLLRLHHLEGAPVNVSSRTAPGQPIVAQIKDHQEKRLRLRIEPGDKELSVEITTAKGAASLALDDVGLVQGQCTFALRLRPAERPYPQTDPVACTPDLRPAIEQAMIEWDWRMQDGIDTPREPRSYAQATVATLDRGRLLLDDLAANGLDIAPRRANWSALRARLELLQRDPQATSAAWEALWLNAHRWQRETALANPLANVGPLLFAKHVPSTMSHQLTQYYGYTARPGGGTFVLQEPGRSMRTRPLTSALPAGSYLHPEISFDADRIYFAFCPCDTGPRSWGDAASMGRRYHLYSMRPDGSDLRQLTSGDYDDFAPRCLPNGKLVFVSTRRGGFHRCGRGPCYVYSLATADADGSNPRPISFHETNEWDPAVLHDGRLIYTRWDYVDRNAVFYQQLWSAWQDGSHVQIYYGNNTFNPVGTWEARPIPNSSTLIATAAPHHGMTAGSIIRLDVARGIDGPEPITRLTPDAMFPEAESGLAFGISVDKPTRSDDVPAKTWGPQGLSAPTRLKEIPPEERRWPGHCYRSPWPLSETYFLAAYSFDRLRGEPGTNLPNMFGLYLCDAFGNKELLYRDPNISSQWPIPLRKRPRPPVMEMSSKFAGGDLERPEGTFFLDNVYRSWPGLPQGVQVTQLRIIQVLPKTTPHINAPRVGAANASPGKQVLGSVPVERDGSAYFRVPARIPVLFQALDQRGRAVQTMRSLTYLQPGEQVSCVGCHEPRHSAQEPSRRGVAAGRPPSVMTPGPDGSRPLSYPILIQPVLDRHCVSCHRAEKSDGGIVLTGEPQGQFTRSYNSLVQLVAYTAWGNPQNNHEPLTPPDQFGARASRLTALLDRGHYDVKLSTEEWERLITWVDANALFYGTFNPADQARQLRGERIAGPGLE